MKKILLIEDERALHKAIGDFLEGDDIKIISAFDGKDGLNKAEKEKPDLIILDLILPKIQGIDVLKMIRSNPSTKDIPVVIFTNLHDFNAMQETVQCGINCYLLKDDYTISDLVGRVKEILHNI